MEKIELQAEIESFVKAGKGFTIALDDGSKVYPTVGKFSETDGAWFMPNGVAFNCKTAFWNGKNMDYTNRIVVPYHHIVMIYE